MPQVTIHYFTEDIVFALPKKAIVTKWIKQLIAHENAVLGYLNFIFCSDRYLYAHNMQFLHHDTLPDVITFDYSEAAQLIEGEVYISIDRVCENAAAYQVPLLQELHRVMAHGVLHLVGYRDKKNHEKAIMRSKEDLYLVIYQGMLLPNGEAP